MIKRTCYIIFLTFLAITSGKQNVYAQDAHFSQFYANPIYLSPSLAGATDGGRLILNYRNQWPGISNAFSTYSVSFDNFFPLFNSGIGFYLMQDQAGSAGLQTTNAAFQYSYNLIINENWQVVPGIQFEYGNKAIDFSKLIFADEEIGGGSSGSWDRLENESTSYVDFAASVFAYSQKYWAGITLNHLSKPNYTFLGEEMKYDLKYTFFGGINIWHERKRTSVVERSFSFSFRYQHQAKYNQVDVGVYWHNSPIELGVWYRGLPFGNEDISVNQDAIVALIAYDLGPFRVGYSYDITISGLGIQSAGAHEISLIFEFNQKLNLRSGGRRPAVPCSSSANPLTSSQRKYKRKSRKIF
ncbi:MAG: type IX secretion system membrane protein PorP/SprF [Chlorobi bacterium]|nr:type IX secretion system membrane protein PorP/SprF [Chlorobiota bacterium]